MKTKEELNALKKEVETLNQKLTELTEDELKLIIGGAGVDFAHENSDVEKEFHFYDNTVKTDFEPNFTTGSKK